MSLPAPNLDNRKFQDIVDGAKRQIVQRCPEWTDHNLSDPGVTLIELFAWMTEMMLYRLNQVPEKNYIKFLDMLGISLEPPAAAETELRFDLASPIKDSDVAEKEILLRARDTVAATVRTETEQAIEFSTDADLRLVRPRLTYILSAARLSEDSGHILRDARSFLPDDGGATDGEFAIFGLPPAPGNAIYFGFEADVSANVVELELKCVSAAATGLNPDYPAQVWEYWGTEGLHWKWRRFETPVADTTFGFNLDGKVQLVMPRNLGKRPLGGHTAHWVRCRYTMEPQDVPPRGPDQLSPSPYQRSPEIKEVTAQVVGGTAPASHSTSYTNVLLGHSDGLPGQVFAAPHAPILERRLGETLLVAEPGQPAVEYEEKSDFSQSHAQHHHFVCDSLTGHVRFGPRVLQPDGTARQHGAIPPLGHSITFKAYRSGGGVHGNLREGQIRVLKTSIPYISQVTNLSPALGGRNQETLERAKLRAQELLHTRDRAVTAADFEVLAKQASPGVGRARCIQSGAIHPTGLSGKAMEPGVVRVLLIPALAQDVLIPRIADLFVPGRVRQEVESYLDERRLLTTVVEVADPLYVCVSTDITLVAAPAAEPDEVARLVREDLARYLHPLHGGPAGGGWPFQRPLTLADIYGRVHAVPGVAFLIDVRITVARVINSHEGLLSPERTVSSSQGVLLKADELICTHYHRIFVRPLSSVGTDVPAHSGMGLARRA